MKERVYWYTSLSPTGWAVPCANEAQFELGIPLYVMLSSTILRVELECTRLSRVCAM